MQKEAHKAANQMQTQCFADSSDYEDGRNDVHSNTQANLFQSQNVFTQY